MSRKNLRFGVVELKVLYFPLLEELFQKFLHKPAAFFRRFPGGSGAGGFSGETISRKSDLCSWNSFKAGVFCSASLSQELQHELEIFPGAINEVGISEDGGRVVGDDELYAVDALEDPSPER